MKIDDLRGISYILYMDNKKEFIRESQPCYGELRKYERTHPGRCTQPLDDRPGDLKTPFPEGTPTSLVIPFNPNWMGYVLNDCSDSVFLMMFSDKSPWISGFKEVEFLEKNGHIFGVRLPNLDIDPTVLVNLLKNFRKFLGNVDVISELLSEGMTENEAMVSVMLNGMGIKQGICAPDGYSCPTYFSLKRFFNQNPKDLTGGTLQDRVDYNRKEMANIFQSDSNYFSWSATSIPLARYSGKMNVLTSKEFVRAVKPLLQSFMSTEPDPVDQKYIWKTTGGDANGTV